MAKASISRSREPLASGEVSAFIRNNGTEIGFSISLTNNSDKKLNITIPDHEAIRLFEAWFMLIHDPISGGQTTESLLYKYRFYQMELPNGDPRK